ncbi:MULTISPECIES: glutamate 5-kinase [Devosia]|uniref:Glutamate 5-kinase n=1 Tax=Devosia equisanguinis TaxID=2490941 RepID=A0A447IEK0_9HYPH|nr:MULTISPECIES: glutamate 5-kinase [Devosia]ODT51325.1 MAG: glutamate 5-kinase [Pelagibacterium sp. SCN 63-126]ODU86615.1 MAG: glutamate 5-kinase [Pelagibacterium sp. SCN 63-17]OJX41789.1 MAG: glutamate 5-kinase [Devosia sp. 63-57]VDS05896.1 Glutamate 5-kinase [Devosia equisanguinis]
MNPLAPYRRITIKIGSALLVDKAGKLRAAWLADLAEDIAALKSEGREIVIVSSGAIALGRGLLGLSAVTLTLEQSQAAASAGQIALSQAWAEALGRHQIVTGQILITPNITEERRYFLNARTTIQTLLGLGAIPIINENDSVATAEIRYGDNDRLSARVATMIEADLLVLLSDIDGLYTAPPAKDPAAAHIPVVERITPAIEAMAGGAASHLSRGGMTTKVEAGKIATLAGTAMIIAKGTETHPLKRLGEGGLHTLFQAATSRAQSRKRWIMGTLAVSGTVQVDAGAAGALKNGRSLLPVGVTRITGEFERGDTIAVIGPDGIEIARGLSGLDSDDARLVMGKKSHAIVELLGAGNRAEMVHRDNMVLTGSKEELAS